MQHSQAQLNQTPPLVEIPREYNAAYDLLMRHAERAHKTAFIDGQSGRGLTYGQLTDQSWRFANALRAQGLKPESRVMLCMLDTPEWVVAFLGCMLAGVVPIATNTLLTSKDFDYMLRDSRAQGLFVSHALLPSFEPLLAELPAIDTVWVAGAPEGFTAHPRLEAQIAAADPRPQCHPTCSDDICFWLYSSGSTGSPKGTVHLHSHLIQTAELYGQGVLGIRESDVVYSAAKLFFAYGLGNAFTFPMSVGATTVLLPARPTTDDVFGILKNKVADALRRQYREPLILEVEHNIDDELFDVHGHWWLDTAPELWDTPESQALRFDIGWDWVPADQRHGREKFFQEFHCCFPLRLSAAGRSRGSAPA